MLIETGERAPVETGSTSVSIHRPEMLVLCRQLGVVRLPYRLG